MTRFVIRDGQLTPKHLARPHAFIGRRLGHAPAIRTDGMDALQSMADGRFYDSKSAYYRSVRDAGCEIVGDDREGFSAPPGYEADDVEDDILQAAQQLMGT